MKHRQFMQIIGRRLPHVKRDHIADVLEVAAEVWAEALQDGEATVTLMHLGKLQVEVQQMKLSGAVRARLEARDGYAPATMRRLYFRFRPAGWLRAQVEAAHEAQEI